MKKELQKEDSKVIVPNAPRAWGSRGGTVGIELRENEPVLVDRKEFNYTYKCMHCGREWSEVHTEELKGTEPRGDTPETEYHPK